jgi:hypothetical protein
VQNPAVEAGGAPQRHPYRLAGLIAGGAVVVLALAALGLFLWVRSYEPLSAADGAYAPGPGLSADIEPVTGSGGKPVFIPAYRKDRAFDTAFTLRNTGRFAVTVTGLVQARRAIGPTPIRLFSTDSTAATAEPGHLQRLSRFRLDPDDSATVVVRWHLECGPNKAEVSADTLPLRYRYLSTFTRTEPVVLPFAVTLRCEGRPQASP